MATYYVRPGGTGNGTGPALNQAWGTFQAPFTSGSGVTGGDTVYIGPGNYNEQVTITITNPTSTINVIGDTTASQFSGMSAGKVRLSGFDSAGNNAASLAAPQLTATSKDFFSFTNIIFEGIPTGGTQLVRFNTSKNIAFYNCLFVNEVTSTINANSTLLNLVSPTSTAGNFILSRCIFQGNGEISVVLLGQNVADNTSVRDCVFAGRWINAGLFLHNIQAQVVNNSFFFMPSSAIYFLGGSGSFQTTINNCLFVGNTTGIFGTSTVGVEDYNRFIGNASNRTGSPVIATGANSKSVGASRLDYSVSRLIGLNAIDFYSPEQSSPNQEIGTATGALASDIFGVTWTGVTPDAGAITYKSLATLTPTYQPTERNASTITIAPASTSQSIELYLGATGLTFATSGLAAYFVRNREAPTPITLVTQTPTGAWASGGFAEISSSLVPGVYRLDVPDAAFAAGASDVTIVVRGASGTNGAVLTVTLSSGGLTAAQTAAAVWDEPYTSHTTASTFGARTLKTVADNRLVNVGTANHIEANVHAIVNSTAAADELSGALLHNGTDYISADLLTPVSAATSVHIGPYQLLADGLGADQPLDVNVGTATSIDVQVTDANGTGIDITGATVSAKVYSSAGTLVATYAGTATYADNGRLTFGLTTTVTNTSGTYTVTVTRTTGATDTQIFGPLRLYVRPA